MRVGFIGVGNIGLPMAEQILKAGFPLVIHDIRKDAAASLIQQGASWADSPKEVAQQSDVVCTCLPGPPEMEEVVLGDAPLAEDYPLHVRWPRPAGADYVALLGDFLGRIRTTPPLLDKRRRGVFAAFVDHDREPRLQYMLVHGQPHVNTAA